MAWPLYKTDNMRGDPFTHIISTKDANGNIDDHVGGADNAAAAQAAFDVLLYYYQEHQELVLRERGRILREERGTGGWYRDHLKRTLGIDSP